MSRGIHTKPNEGFTSNWLTPPHIIEALGEFDLDPCAAMVDGKAWPTAEHHYIWRGLVEPWFGRVWLNPPYGSQSCAKWLSKLAEHGNGIALVASRTEVEAWFWPFIWESASAILFLRGRLYFHDHLGMVASGNAGHGSVLVAYGASNIAALRNSGLAGALVQNWQLTDGDK